MCMFCAAIPTVAATGLLLDAHQRQEMEKSGKPQPRLRPFLVLTALAMPILLIGAVLFHSRFSWIN